VTVLLDPELGWQEKELVGKTEMSTRVERIAGDILRKELGQSRGRKGD